jgi:hypothetical protein
MLKHYEMGLMHPYSSRALQYYQEHGKRHCGLGRLNLKNKTNKVPSLTT